MHFFKLTVLWWPQRDPERTSLLRLNSMKNQSLSTSRGTRLPPLRIQTNLGKSLLVLGSPVLVDDPECYLAVYSRYLPPPSWKILGAGGGGGGLVKRYQGNTHPVERYCGGLGWKILGNTHPVERHWESAQLKDTGNTYPGERNWREVLVERFQGLFSCRRLSGLHWVVS